MIEFIADHHVRDYRMNQKMPMQLLEQGGRADGNISEFAYQVNESRWNALPRVGRSIWGWDKKPLILIGETKVLDLATSASNGTCLIRAVRKLGLEIAVGQKGWRIEDGDWGRTTAPVLVSIYHPATIGRHYQRFGVSSIQLRGEWEIPKDVGPVIDWESIPGWKPSKNPPSDSVRSVEPQS